MSGNFYRAFEERYRGSRELIKGRLRVYTPFLAPLAALYPGAPAIDLGCGRGEWLELTVEEGFAASGVDLDEGMLAACRERGLNVQTADALATLRAQADASVALVSAFHLVEHLPFDDVQLLIAESLRILLPGGVLIMETPNPENLVVGTNNFYLDPSHVKPLPPLLLDFLTEHAGFARHVIVRLQETQNQPEGTRVGLQNVLQDVSGDYAVVAQKQADAAVWAPFDAAFGATYGVSLMDLAARFDQDASAPHLPLVDNMQAGLAALDQEVRAQGKAINELAQQANLQASAMAGLDQQANAQGAALAGLDQALQSASAHLTNRFVVNEEANAQAMANLEQGQAAASARIEELHAQLLLQFGAMEQRVAQAIEQLAHSEHRVNAVEERRLHSKRAENRRLNELEQRVAQSDRRLAALPDYRLRDAEKLVAQSQQQLEQAEQRVQELEGQVGALLTSSSWRITAPARSAGALARRALSAVREGRIKSGLRRRLVTLVLGPPGADATRGVRGWLRRTKNSTWARRIVLPLLNRFPQLREPLRRLAEGVSPVSPLPSPDVFLPDWHGPLPAEYLNMTTLGRKVLLDLARDPSSNP